MEEILILRAQENMLSEKEENLRFLKEKISDFEAQVEIFKRYITWAKDVINEGGTVESVMSILSESERETSRLE